MVIKSHTTRLRSIDQNKPYSTNTIILRLCCSLVDQPGLDQPSILLRDDTRRTYLLGGLQPNRKYRVQVRAQTSAGLSTRPAIIELTTNQTLGKINKHEDKMAKSSRSVPSKPTFIVTQRGQTFFNISFDPMIMTVPGSIYFVHYKETDDSKYDHC